MYPDVETQPFNIAIVIHAFYAKQLQYILEKVNAIVFSIPKHVSIDIYITANEASEPEIHQVLQARNLNIKIQQFSNHGMDLLPFFKILPQLQSYDWILKLHTKNTSDNLSQTWFERLIEGLIGTPKVFFDTVRQLQINKNWSMAGLMPFFVSAKKLMLNNYDNVNRLAECWGLDVSDDWGFFAGSLFWVKPSSLIEASAHLVNNEEWFFEDFKKDGQIAHAVERLVTRIAQNSGAIGLFMPFESILDENKAQPLVVYSSKHNHSINHVSTTELIESYNNLMKETRILLATSLLDTKLYSEQLNIDFKNHEQAIQHFLLIGQYNGFDSFVYPIQLKKYAKGLVDWQKQLNAIKEREEGLVSIIIPVLNNFKKTLSCLQSVYRHTKNVRYEIILLDNASTKIQGLGFDLYSKFRGRISVLHMSKNVNFSTGCNYGFSKSKGSIVVFLNNDTQVTEGWLAPIISSLQKSDVIAVQPRLLYFNDTVQCAGVTFGADGFGVCRFEGDDKDNYEVNQSIKTEALTGACMALHALDFIKVKGFDAWFVNGQEDMDLCLRLKKLYPSKSFWYEAGSTVYHYKSSTKGRKRYTTQNRVVFKAIWG